MHTICMLSLKGGAGKSTVVQSLAVCAVEHGQKTLIVELDPQGSLKNWSKRRQAFEPRVHQTLPQSLGDVLDDARDKQTNWVFIDTPGHDTSTAAAAAACADLIIIPCKVQSMKDFDSVMLTLAEANRVKKPAYVLMNQVPPNSPKLVRQKQVEIQREYEIAVLSKCLSRRADFEYCDAKGMSAGEYNPDGAAAQEIKRLYALIQSIFITLKPQRLANPLGGGVISTVPVWQESGAAVTEPATLVGADKLPEPAFTTETATAAETTSVAAVTEVTLTQNEDQNIGTGTGLNVETEVEREVETDDQLASADTMIKADGLSIARPRSIDLPDSSLHELEEIETSYDVENLLRSNKWGS